MNNKRVFMLIAIIGLAIGFATVSTVLYINGTATIGGNPEAFERDVVFFEPNGSEGTEVVLSESGRTITFTTNTLMKLEDKAEVKFKIKNYSQYDATLDTPAISCYFVDAHSEDTKAVSTGTTNEYVSITPDNTLNGVTILAGGGVSEEGKVQIEVTKTYAGNGVNADPLELKFQCNINVKAGDSTTPGIEKPTASTEIACNSGYKYPCIDHDGNGIVSIGDEIAVGDEHFYIISNDGNTLNAFAKYNLNVGNLCTTNSSYSCTPIENPTGIQAENMTGSISINGNWEYGRGSTAFSSDDQKGVNVSDYNGSIVEGYVNAYAEYIENNGTTLVKNADNYNKGARLIKKEEIEALVSDGESLSFCWLNEKADPKGYQWLYSTTYFTGTPDYTEGATNELWCVYSNSIISSNRFLYDGYDYGVRPVISLEV